jgi:signal transduction histidine kinase
LLFDISRSTGTEWGGWIRYLCQFEADVLHVERVNFWSFDEHAGSLRCDAGYVTSSRAFEHGATLLSSEAPAYFEALRNTRILNVHDVNRDARMRGLGDYCAARGIASMLDVPVFAEGRLAGVLCHEHVGPRRHWTRAEEDFAAGVGQVVGSAMAARAHTCAEAAARRASFLDSVSRAVMSSLDAGEIARCAVALAVPRIADAALVWLRKSRDGIECVASIHADPAKRKLLADLTQTSMDMGEVPVLAAQVVRQNQSLLLPDVRASLPELGGVSPTHQRFFDQFDIRSGIGVPLGVGGRPIGAMTFLTENRAYDSDDRALAEEVGARVACGLENARLYSIAREAVRARDDFLVLVTHELRTPLTALQLMADDLVRRAGRADDAGESGRAGAIARQARKLSGLVEHVIDASRIRAGGVRLELDACDLAMVVESCVARVAERARCAATPLSVQAASPLVGQFDRIRIERAVYELVDNALKFGLGKPVEVSLDRPGAEAELRVRDHGAGIPGDRLGMIFAPFERAVPIEHFGGLGLGLYIARAIIDAHGGSIAAESHVGEGTTFVVRLPVDGVAAVATESARPALDGAAGSEDISR